ncbi:MAG TPA: toll/interleukin-1 receptor domain-containing protein [Polyangia bacterium]|jgi:hypothetical protein|nr:toll/interleukin-1 receptor domain-containing protein [Polyangia bacterium]
MIASFPVFISHSSRDTSSSARDIADWLGRALSELGVRVWSYRRNSVPGALLVQEYLEAVRKSQGFIILWDAQSAQSPYVKDELKSALTGGKTIVLVALDDTALPEELGGRVFLRWSSPAQVLSGLSRAFGLMANGDAPDHFTAFGRRWRVYKRDRQRYPLFGPSLLALEGTPQSRMDVQTEEDFDEGRLDVRLAARWREETSVGFEKWYGGRRFSIRLQGPGRICIERPRLRGSEIVVYQARPWSTSERDEVEIALSIDRNRDRTTIVVDGKPVFSQNISIPRPLKVRLNADFEDHLRVMALDVLPL